jgi:hypothetical protein
MVQVMIQKKTSRLHSATPVMVKVLRKLKFALIVVVKAIVMKTKMKNVEGCK